MGLQINNCKLKTTCRELSAGRLSAAGLLGTSDTGGPSPGLIP